MTKKCENINIYTGLRQDFTTFYTLLHFVKPFCAAASEATLVAAADSDANVV